MVLVVVLVVVVVVVVVVWWWISISLGRSFPSLLVKD